MTRQSIAGRGRSHVFTGLADHRLVVRTTPAMTTVAPRAVVSVSGPSSERPILLAGKLPAQRRTRLVVRGRRQRWIGPAGMGPTGPSARMGALLLLLLGCLLLFRHRVTPLPHPRVPRLDRSCGDCTGRIRGVSSGKYTLRCLVSAGPLHLGTRAIARSALRRARFLRASRMACDARAGERIPG